MAYKRRGAVPLSRSAGNPSIIQCGLRRCLLPYQVASSSIQPFGHNAVGGVGRFRYRTISVHTLSVHVFFGTSSFGTLNVDIDTVTCGALSRDVRGDVFVDVDSLSDRPAVINI